MNVMYTEETSSTLTPTQLLSHLNIPPTPPPRVPEINRYTHRARSWLFRALCVTTSLLSYHALRITNRSLDTEDSGHWTQWTVDTVDSGQWTQWTVDTGHSGQWTLDTVDSGHWTQWTVDTGHSVQWTQDTPSIHPIFLFLSLSGYLFGVGGG